MRLRYQQTMDSIVQRIDFEHMVKPGAFPTEPTGSKTMKVIVE